MLSFKSMRKTKLSLAMSALLVGGLFSSSAQAVQLAGDDKLGDAGIFQYYSANGDWQTFFRIINTSNSAVAVKVRFREAANSRDIKDFVVALSPNDMWSAWTGATAGPNGEPGVRTNDTSCIFDLTNTGGSTFQWVNQANNLQAVAFSNAAFTGAYNDGTATSLDAARLAEGYVEVIGIASYGPLSRFANEVTHNQATGKPENCSAGLNIFRNGAIGADVPNVLGFNAQLINTDNGEGAGYDPVVLANFKVNSALGSGSLVREVRNSATTTGVGHGAYPTLDSADPHSVMLTANGNAIASTWDVDGDGFSSIFSGDVAMQQLLANGSVARVLQTIGDLTGDGVATNNAVPLHDATGTFLGNANEAAISAAQLALLTGNKLSPGTGGGAGVACAPAATLVGATCFNIVSSSAGAPAFTFSASGQTSVAANALNPARLTNLPSGAVGVPLRNAVRGGIDAVSAVLARNSISNEWAASATPNAANVKDYFTQWVVTFPTKNYYVDLQDDPVSTDLFAPTLQDPRGDAGTDVNDAFAPFSNEYNLAGTSCESVGFQLWDREEATLGFTSPVSLPSNSLCNEVNVVSFSSAYAGRGLASAFGVTVGASQLPISGVTGQLAQRGWARMSFTGTGAGTGLTAHSNVGSVYANGGTPQNPTTFGPGLVRYQGLPVVGFGLANYATGNAGANHNAINAHKYTRAAQIVNTANNPALFSDVNASNTTKGVGFGL